VPWAREAHSFKIHSVRSRSVPLVRLIIILSLLYNREREGGRERERERVREEGREREKGGRGSGWDPRGVDDQLCSVQTLINVRYLCTHVAT